MQETSTDRIEVCLVDTALSATDLTTGSLSAAAVDSIGDVHDLIATASVDCFVTDFEDGTTVEALTAAYPDRPLLVFADPADGVAERALAAGATDVVAAVGPDRLTRLANRAEAAVELARTRTAHETVRARFEALTENAPFAVVTIDENSAIQYASDGTETVLGYDPAAVVGDELTEMMPERFHESHFDAISQYLESGDRSLDWDWIELPGEHRDGHEIPLGISFGERKTENGRLFTAILRDITDQRTRQAQLDRLATAVEGSMDGIAILDEDDEYRYVNEAHADVYGFERPEEMVGLKWRECYGPDERERFEETVMSELAATGRWRGEATGQRADGETFPQEVSLTRLDDGGIVCVVRDISDRVARREQLRDEREFTESVLNALPDLFYVLDEAGSFQRWNDRLREVTGYTDEELDGMGALEVVPTEDREDIAEAITNIHRDGTTEVRRSAILTKQGERIPYELNGTDLTDADGNVIGLAGTGRDITDQQLREQRLSVLSRVLRHNVRNQLTVVNTNADYAASAVDDDGALAALDRVLDASKALAEVSDNAQRAQSVLRGGTNRSEVDLVSAVDTALADADADGTDIRTSLPERAPAIAVESVAVAVVELVENAAEHTDSDTVKVRVTRGGDRVYLSVADDGPGIPDNVRDVLTAGRETKLQHATGIGLWLVNWVVTASGGDVQFRGGDDGGEVVLRFPSA
ncbi:PAS domain S-box protein [Halorientalis litorea]|uniref:PAS domain S-box protein n=1 Tax=Halorientalis litorea TaxID=2931977 RepID=UPI001FF4180E|nr:PAS domain S-box protein [Halorientalis litorea]